MAKLFCTVDSEKNEVHKIANRELEICVYYGNAEDSRLALKVVVKAQENAFDFPSIFIEDLRTVKPIITHV
jgi:hypothetical protein